MIFSIMSNAVEHFGAWLSLVERHVRDVEAACSNHVAPIWLKPLRCKGFFFCVLCRGNIMKLKLSKSGIIRAGAFSDTA